MSVKETRFYPETGWGMPFVYFFDSTVVVDNRAKNGRSTKSFIEENLWQPVVSNLQEGDYVFIQFGHNDEVKEKVGRYTTLEEFKTNLLRYVNESRKRKAIPVLLTPVARRRFDSNGKVVETHPFYSDAVREIAKKNSVPLVDLDKKSQELLQKFGPETSKYLYLQLQPGEHPNYPNGKDDNTHFNELGARETAQLVLGEIKKLKLELAERIVNYQHQSE
jgi:lysophospholipase L1-like esterase